VSNLIGCLFKSLGQVYCVKVTQFSLEIMAFFIHSLGGQLLPRTYTFLSSQSHFPTTGKSPWNKGRRWDSTGD